MHREGAMKTSTFVLRRTAYAILTLFGLSILVFIIARVLPGDPARMAAGPRAPGWVVEQIRQQLGLNKPLYEQYFSWLFNLFHGDLGYSLYSQRNVSADVLEFLPASLELVFLAAIFEVVGAFTLGIIGGSYSNKWPDTILRIISYVGIAIPSFVLAIVLQLVFTWYIPIFPTFGRLSTDVLSPQRITGFISIDSLITGRLDALGNLGWHLVLPAFAVCAGGMLQDARIIRSGMVENQSKDYITMAVSKGMPTNLIRFRYLLKPSIIPAITVMGMDIASILANAFLVERIFNYPGFSKYGITVMLAKDLNGIVAVVLVVGIIFTIANILADIIVGYVDPRIRLMERGD